jgi:hypothetical protein
VTERVTAVKALFRLRAAQDMVGLADTHGPVKLEAGVRQGDRGRCPSYRTIKGILAVGLKVETRAGSGR